MELYRTLPHVAAKAVIEKMGSESKTAASEEQMKGNLPEGSLLFYFFVRKISICQYFTKFSYIVFNLTVTAFLCQYFHTFVRRHLFNGDTDSYNSGGFPGM